MVTILGVDQKLLLVLCSPFDFHRRCFAAQNSRVIQLKSLLYPGNGRTSVSARTGAAREAVCDLYAV
jgi:hypothetical protein